MTGRIEGLACIVTGAGGGIGSAAAKRFAKEGAVGVVCCDINFASVSLVAQEINSEFPNRAIAVQCDVSNSAQVLHSVKLCVETFHRLDVYFANAGVLGKYVPLAEETAESFERTLQVNTLGGFLAIKHASEAMKTLGNGGSIILTSSIASIRADVTPLQYAASKGALLSLVVSANDRLLLDKIRVNAVLPGGVLTEMALGVSKDLDSQGLQMAGYDFARFPFIEVEQVANVVLFLASAESEAIKGQFIVADGGMANSMGSQPPLVRKTSRNKKAGNAKM
jgi:NAD(P)-dependent dehydrogenase (short-subunit alcohol dehydrogenase family)